MEYVINILNFANCSFLSFAAEVLKDLSIIYYSFDFVNHAGYIFIIKDRVLKLSSEIYCR